MTDRRELEELAGKIEEIGGAVFMAEDQEGWIETVRILGLEGIGAGAMGPIAAAERMREIIANRSMIAEHPITGAKFKYTARVWQVIVDAPRHKNLVSYPGSGQSLYTFKEAVKVCTKLCTGKRDAWLESEHMRMDLETAQTMEV